MHLWNQNFFVPSLQTLGSLLLFKNSNLLVVNLKKSGLELILLLTWIFSNLLLTTTTLQSSKQKNFTTLLFYHQIWQILKNSGTQSTNYFLELPNLSFLHLSIWIPYLSHLQHFSQTKFRNFDLQLYLAPPLPHHICLQFSNLLSYPFSILQPLLKYLHSYQVLLTLHVILIQFLPLSSNNANLFFFPQSQISSTYLCPLESFLINSKTVLYIHFSKNPTLTKKTYPTTDQYLTYLTYPNSQNDLLKTDLLTISMKTTSWTLSSLPTPNSTLLKPLYLLYTTTLSEPWVNSKSLVCVFLIFLLPLTLLTIPFFYIDSNLGLVSLTLSYPGFSLTFHLVPLLLISMASNLLPLNFSTVFLKALFLVLCSSYSIQHHSVQ